MLRLLFLAHRYLGMALGLVLVLWCLSGFVMMYKPYPELSVEQQYATLEALELQGCCADVAFPPREAELAEARIRMLDGKAILESVSGDGDRALHALDTGTLLPRVDAAVARSIAESFAAARGLDTVMELGLIERDQWTVYGANNRHRPLYHYAAGDPERTEWYVSSRTGEIIQHTTADQRLWGYLGAVIHWLYPTLLRQHVALWSQTVIWLTIGGIFLTATGLYFGWKQYRSGKSGRISPYRGLSRWHHYTGLLFGILTLSWVFSGLFSMNPWGLLEGDSAAPEQAALQGGLLTTAEVQDFLRRLPRAELPQDTVSLELRKALGDTAVIAVKASGTRLRLDPQQLRVMTAPSTLATQAAQRLLPGVPVQTELLYQGDAYYYDHHVLRTFPVLRIQAQAGEGNRYYLDPLDATLLSKIDTERRWYRWLFYGLHRGDFTALLRSRPVWDLFMWTLLLGVTATCLTGLVMGGRRGLRMWRSRARKTQVLHHRQARSA